MRWSSEQLEAKGQRIKDHLSERLLVDGWKRTAGDLKLSEGTIRRWAKNLELECPPDDRGAKPTELTKEQEGIVLFGYPIKSPWLIAKEIGLTGEVVIGFLKRRGLYQGVNRRASAVVDKEFFRWSRDFAYVLGYMYADGSIGEYRKIDSDSHGERNLTYCSLTSKDEEILRNIGNRMGLKSKPYSFVRRRHQRIIETGKYWRLSTSCRWVFNKWIEYGLRPRKSYVGMDIPKVPKKFVRHFVRGFFDGDGSKYVNDRGNEYVNFGCTDRLFLEWLGRVIALVVDKDEIHIGAEMYRKTPFYKISIGCNRAKKLLNWMAPGNRDLRLERKWN